MPVLSDRAISSMVETRHQLIVLSTMLIFESKLLLLHRAQRQFMGSNAANDLNTVERQRSDLHRAELALRAGSDNPRAFKSPKHGLWMYTRLVDRALATRKRWTAMCEAMPARDRFEMATDIQMLEDLIAQWRSKIQLINSNRSARAGPPRRRGGGARA
jgi:hypothetical protein